MIKINYEYSLFLRYLLTVSINGIRSLGQVKVYNFSDSVYRFISEFDLIKNFLLAVLIGSFVNYINIHLNPLSPVNKKYGSLAALVLNMPTMFLVATYYFTPHHIYKLYRQIMNDPALAKRFGYDEKMHGFLKMKFVISNFFERLNKLRKSLDIYQISSYVNLLLYRFLIRYVVSLDGLRNYLSLFMLQIFTLGWIFIKPNKALYSNLNNSICGNFLKEDYKNSPLYTHGSKIVDKDMMNPFFKNAQVVIGKLDLRSISSYESLKNKIKILKLDNEKLIKNFHKINKAVNDPSNPDLYYSALFKLMDKLFQLIYTLKILAPKILKINCKINDTEYDIARFMLKIECLESIINIMLALNSEVSFYKTLQYDISYVKYLINIYEFENKDKTTLPIHIFSEQYKITPLNIDHYIATYSEDLNFYGFYTLVERVNSSKFLNNKKMNKDLNILINLYSILLVYLTSTQFCAEFTEYLQHPTTLSFLPLKEKERIIKEYVSVFYFE